MVIPIPDTSRTSAMQVAQHLDVKYREGFVKNRYVGRTFIMPGQEQRSKSVRSKLNAIDLEFRNKNVLLVDDSIVRGTTSAQIIDLAREAGASKVYFASAAPPVKFPNVYGIDMPAKSELVASSRSDDEVAQLIGADWLIYQDLEDLIQACVHDHSSIKEFDTSCFSGHYVTGDVTPEYLARLRVGTLGFGQGDAARCATRPASRSSRSEIAATRPSHERAPHSCSNCSMPRCARWMGAPASTRFLRDCELPGAGRQSSPSARRRAPWRCGARDALGDASIERMLVITKDGHADPALDGDAGVTAARERASRARCAQPEPRSCARAPRARTCRADVFPVVPGLGRQFEPRRSAARRRLARRTCARSTCAVSPAGWDIATLNAERAKLSRLKGGGIARLLDGRRALALFISDVPGDDPGRDRLGVVRPRSWALPTQSSGTSSRTSTCAVRAARDAARMRAASTFEARVARFDGDARRGGRANSSRRCARATATGWCGAANRP